MCVWSEAVRSDSIKFGKCNTLSLKNVSLSLGEMEHNQSHSRESIKITHNRVKRSRLFLNAFMRTLRRANAISAPRKSATREFCKWRTEEHPRETKKNFERDDDEQRERERERAQRETKKKRKERRLVFFLSSSSYLWYLFSRIRAMIESNRGRFMYLHSCWCWCWCCCRRRVVVVFHVQREKKKLWRREEIKPFLVSSFNFFPTLISNRHFNVLLLRAYRVRRTHNRRI